MTDRGLEKLAWVLIYSGLLLACLGFFILREHGVYGGALLVAGMADAAAGVALIWVRSRRPRRE